MNDDAHRVDYQPIVEAVAAVLDLEVTLVDSHLTRVAGTGQYRLRVGEAVHPDSAFGHALRSGHPVKVENPRRDALCLRCGAAALCHEAAHLASPIVEGGTPIGVLGLVAFGDEQRQRLLHGLDGYMEFLQKVSDLIASRQREAQAMLELSAAQGYLRGVADSVSEGLIAADAQGRVTFVNGPAQHLLQLPLAAPPTHLSELPGLEAPMREVLARGESVLNRELRVARPGAGVTVVGSIRPIRAGDRVIGAVASLRDLGDVFDLVYRVDAEQPPYGFDRIIYRSAAMARLVERARRVAQSASTVLVQGESGTGKELFARALHSASPRRSAPFIAINCAAIPDELLESELFGYADGAFTGARRGGKPGKFELAKGGTLFLDEIGDMPLSLQAKLLRVVQDSEVTRLGATESTRLDVRLIAATNQDLEAMMQRREFRADLFFRLNVIPLEIPPLRQRPEDVPLLVDYFRLQRHNQINQPVPVLSEAARQALFRYDWPGNVREVENAIEYAMAMATGTVADVDCLPARIMAARPPAAPPAERIATLAELEQRELERALARYGYGLKAVNSIARDLGVSRATIYRRLRKYKLDPTGS